MKSGSELVKAGVRTFFENAAEDLEKTLENLKLGKISHSRSQMKCASQSINYTTVALLPILTALFQHITQNQIGVDLLCEFSQLDPTPSSKNPSQLVKPDPSAPNNTTTLPHHTSSSLSTSVMRTETSERLIGLSCMCFSG